MKAYPQAVLDMLSDGRINYAYLLTIHFDTPARFTNASFDLTDSGNTYYSSSDLNGIGELYRQTDTTVTDLAISLRMASATANALLLSDIYNTKVTVDRVFLDTDSAVIHREQVWAGLISSYADSDDEKTLTINVSNSFANFDSTNPWRTTPSSHKRRYPNDDCFKFAAKASEITYWGENPTNTSGE